MKKIVALCMTLTVFLALVFGINFTQQNSWHRLHSSYQGVLIEFPQISDDALDVDQLFEDLQAFSDTYQVNVLQFQFRRKNGIDVVEIFSANLTYDENFSSYHGALPQDRYFISTQREDSDSHYLDFLNVPWSNAMPARIFELSEARHFGVWRNFLLSGDNEDVERFVNVFSSYGDVLILEDAIGWLIPNEIGMTLAMMDQNFLFGLIIMVILSLLMIFLLTLQHKKRIFLNILWGDTRQKTLLYLPKTIGLFQLKIISISFVIMCIYLIYQRQFSFFKEYFSVFLIIQAILMGLFVGFALFFNFLVLKINDIITIMNGQKAILKLSGFIFALKSILMILLIYVGLSSLLDWQIVTAQLRSNTDWTRAEDVYRVSFHFDMGLLFRDIEHDFEMMARFADFYQQIREENGAFMIDSQSFPHWIYEDYGSDPFNHCSPDEFFYFGCQVISVDEAYLMRQTTLTPNGENVLSLISNDVNTLNILVPIAHEHLEDEIISYYLESAWFHNINIIYKSNGQTYFTYKNYTGNSNSEIEDPIVLIVNESWNFTAISDMMTSSLFVVDETHQGFDSLAYARENHELVELRSVQSVYRLHEQHLHQIYTRFIRQSVGLALIFSILIFLQVLLTWSVYQVQSYKLTLRHLFGDSFLKVNKSIVSLMLLNYAFLILMAYAIQQLNIVRRVQIERIFYFVFGLRFRTQLSMSVLLRGVIFLFLFELILVYIVGKRQMRLNTEQTLKGEYI